MHLLWTKLLRCQHKEMHETANMLQGKEARTWQPAGLLDACGDHGSLLFIAVCSMPEQI